MCPICENIKLMCRELGLDAKDIDPDNLDAHAAEFQKLPDIVKFKRFSKGELIAMSLPIDEFFIDFKKRLLEFKVHITLKEAQSAALFHQKKNLVDGKSW